MLAGAAIDFFATYVFYFGTTIVLLLITALMDKSEMMRDLYTSAWFKMTFRCLGLGFTLAGGYAAGRIAKKAEMAHGGLVGALGLLASWLLSGFTLVWYELLFAIASLPVGIAGGRLAALRSRRKQAEKEAAQGM